MNIIDMTKDFNDICVRDSDQNKWENWLLYYDKYKGLLDGMMKHLYFCDLKDLKPIVQATDFKKLRDRANSNINKDAKERIKNLVITSLNELSFSRNFDVYFGIVFGHALGVAGLIEGGNPSVYFGLEALEYDLLDFLVPHEVHHMVRASENPMFNIDIVEERLVGEGLGLFFPLTINNKNIDITNMAKTLGVRKQVVDKLISKEEKIKDEIFAYRKNIVNDEIIKKFFSIGCEDIKEDRIPISGYFLGIRIIQKLYENGYAIKTMTNMKAEDLIDIYLKLSAVTLQHP